MTNKPIDLKTKRRQIKIKNRLKETKELADILSKEKRNETTN